MYTLGYVLYALFMVAGAANKRSAATFRFSNIYGDHMVLQMKPHQAVVWGFGEEGQGVTLTFNGKDYHTQVTSGPLPNTGVWKVTLDSQGPGGPYELSASSTVNDTKVGIKIQDVHFGDVWVCSGQSNMQFTVTQVVNASEVIAEAANYPQIRLFTAAEVFSETPLYELKEIEQQWSVASPESVNGGAWKYFSAVCWLFAKNLYDRYKYPIGLVATDWGGTPVESWSSPDALSRCNITSKTPKPRRSYFYSDGFEGPGNHSVLWNAMVHPLLNMTIFGAIWYQGEANAAAPDTYNCTFPAMIDDWRFKWFEGTGGHVDPLFPFGFVQLSSFGSDPTVIGGFPVIRWAQTADYGYVPNFRMNNIFMAVAMDLGNASSPWGSIHPNDKQDVGERLALAARGVAYMDHVYYTGPIVLGIEIRNRLSGNQAEISVLYSSVGASGVEVRTRKGFEVYCTDSVPSHDGVWLQAQIVSNSFSTVTVLSTCPESTQLSGIRYAWRQDPCPFKMCAVYSKAEKLPSPPFVKYGPF